MGRSPCCDKVGLKKGPWTPEEDQKLLAYIEEHGHGSWRALPTKAGLQRCGKSCRLRWTNYLKPDIKRGKFSLQEEQTIIQLHALLGNRWSAIATQLPKRTDNEIKNYWNTHLKKRLTKMGIDPVTHKPKSDALMSSDGQSKHAANLSHMAQWESARLEAEARLARHSKLRSNSLILQSPLGSTPDFSAPSSPLSKSTVPPTQPPLFLDILKAWRGVWTQQDDFVGAASLESPTSTLSYSENAPQLSSSGIGRDNSTTFIEFVGGNTSGSCDGGTMKEDGNEEELKEFGNSNNLAVEEYKDGINENSMSFTSGLHDMTTIALDGAWKSAGSFRANTDDDQEANPTGNFVERFTDLLLSNSSDQHHRSFSEEGCRESNNGGGDDDSGGEYLEDNKNYWNSILNLVNCSPSDSPVF